jgi:hypothetical protein
MLIRASGQEGADGKGSHYPHSAAMLNPSPYTYLVGSILAEEERAAQLWSFLALAARNRQVLSYNLVAKLAGVARVRLGQCLEPVQSYCLLKDLRPLTILVVSEKSGIPGVGFIAAHDIPRTQQEVFSFDWVAHGCPMPEEFERAVRERPSNGIVQIPEA